MYWVVLAVAVSLSTVVVQTQQQTLVVFLTQKLKPAGVQRITLVNHVLRVESAERRVTSDAYASLLTVTCYHLANRPEAKTLREIRIVNKFDRGFVFEAPSRCGEITEAPIGSAVYKALIFGNTHTP